MLLQTSNTPCTIIENVYEKLLSKIRNNELHALKPALLGLLACFEEITSFAASTFERTK